MQLILKLVLAGALVLWAMGGQAAPQMLERFPLESPDKTYTANVEWDDVGFIGRIRMLIYTTGEAPQMAIELPQMKPAPGNLTWINDVWVACESFVATQGAAFFYADVSRRRGYLLEILAPEQDADWIINFTTNDSVSSDSIHTISRGNSSLFPILMRDMPQEGLSYISPDFVYLLADAVDAFVQWRKDQKFKDMKFLSDMAENPALGRIAVMSVDNVAEIVYFPQRTTTTREMLALTERQRLPDGVQAMLTGLDPPDLKVEWLGDTGEFSIAEINDEDTDSSSTELVRGKFEGVSDSPYAGPGIVELLKGGRESAAKEVSSDDKESSPAKDSDEEKKSSSKSSTKSSKPPSKSSSKSSSKKTPSRSK